LRTLQAAAAGAAAPAAPVVWTGSEVVCETLPRDVPLASVSVPFSRPVASSTPFTTLNEVGVNVPLKVPVPSALVNVPVTADVMLFAAAAVVAAELDEVAAKALLAMIAGMPIPIDSATADAVIRRVLGSLMCFPLCFSFGNNVRQQLAKMGNSKLVHPHLSVPS
jgi:hypothetical protein